VEKQLVEAFKCIALIPRVVALTQLWVLTQVYPKLRELTELRSVYGVVPLTVNYEGSTYLAIAVHSTGEEDSRIVDVPGRDWITPVSGVAVVEPRSLKKYFKAMGFRVLEKAGNRVLRETAICGSRDCVISSNSILDFSYTYLSLTVSCYADSLVLNAVELFAKVLDATRTPITGLAEKLAKKSVHTSIPGLSEKVDEYIATAYAELIARKLLKIRGAESLQDLAKYVGRNASG